MNCPNCGAPITGPICEYCGTTYESPEYHAEKIADAKREIKRLELEMAQIAQTQQLLSVIKPFNAFTETGG